MSLKSSITSAMVEAMRAKEKARLDTLRLILAKIKQAEVDKGKRDTGLEDTEIVGLLSSMLKERKDAIDQFTAGKRLDLAEKEQKEINVIQEFLPEPLSTEEVNQIIHSTLQECGAKTIADMGTVMQLLKSRLQGRTDMSQVSVMVKHFLSKKD